jgi:protein O-mannosyl-transferase
MAGRCSDAVKPLDEAIEHLNAAVKTDPRYGEGHYYLAMAQAGLRKWPGAAAHLKIAIECSPNFPYAYNDTALILVTQDKAPLRNVPQGLELGEKACRLRGHQELASLQTIAIAYAEAGWFDEAVGFFEKASGLATARGNSELSGQLRSQLTEFKQHRSLEKPNSTHSIDSP